MPDENGRILPGLPALKKLTPDEEKYRSYIEHHRNLVLRDLRELSEHHKMVVLKEAVVAILTRDFVQGTKGDAFRLFVKQISDGMSKRRDTSIEGLLEPGKIGGGVKR